MLKVGDKVRVKYIEEIGEDYEKLKEENEKLKNTSQSLQSLLDANLKENKILKERGM
jgi:FtsZ-binding cell division protein ZapB